MQPPISEDIDITNRIEIFTLIIELLIIYSSIKENTNYIGKFSKSNSKFTVIIVVSQNKT